MATSISTERFRHQQAAGAQCLRVSEDPAATLSAHFSVREFQCNDGTDVLLVHDHLIDLLEVVRAHFGDGPVVVNSGFRTGAYNAAIGGASHSRHMMGLAADIDVAGAPPEAVADYAEKLAIGGVGRYRTFTHVDVEGAGRRWDRR